MNKIIQGDSLIKLRDLDSESVDLICTDPPYGYSFMGKDWDKAVPSVELWRECLRVLKPGAFAFVMSAPRSDVQSQMIMRLTEAGFRLDFTPIYWTYASGFPKAGNIGKMVDKRLGNEREAIGENTFGSTSYNQYQEDGRKEKATGTRAITKGSSSLEGSYGGFQPKPAVEVVIVAMKPLSEKTFVDQALKSGKGITWLDDVRVPYGGETPNMGGRANAKMGGDQEYGFKVEGRPQEPNTQGRFPANLIVSGNALDPECHCGKDGHALNSVNCPSRHGENYSRYFDLDKWASTLPFLIVPKASKGEKNEGLDGFEEKEHSGEHFATTRLNDLRMDKPQQRLPNKNHHPTVKPLKLMSYLITLGSRAGDVVLDPFVGSGTTCIAAKQLNREYIGIEREAEYAEIAEARLKSINPTLPI